MKNFSRCIGISTLCAVLFLGFATHASTGDASTGSMITGTTITYTGSLLSYLNAQENNINSLFTTTYGNVYSAFTKTGLNILKSVDYQSLVCLGAIQSDSLLSQLQKDKTSLMTSFQKDFIDLQNQISALEYKNNLQQSDNVNVFDPGTTYESEKAKLKDLIDTKVKLYRDLIKSFETNYTSKNNDFLSTFSQYSTANKDLVQGISDKMAKVQSVLDAFSGVDTMVNAINAKVTGLDDLMQKIDTAKTDGLANLDKTIQLLIDKNVKIYKKLTTLSDELTQQKTFVVGEYQMDLDEYMTDNLQSRYNRTQYLALQNDVNTFKSTFYTTNNQLNCSSILGTTDASMSLLTRINAMSAAVSSGRAKLQTDGISTTFKDQLFSGFQSLYIQKFKQRYSEYQGYLNNQIQTDLKNLTQSAASTVPTTTTTTTTTTPTTTTITTPGNPSKVTFTRAFKNGEYSNEIKALQNILTTLGFYTGPIDGIYSKATIEAVYKFQVSKGLVNAKNTKAWGYFGPATRNALNNLIK